MNGKKLIAAAILAGLVLLLGFWVRVHQTAETDQRLCEVLVAVIEGAGRPSAVTTDYYRTRPGELARAQAQYDRTLGLLDCGNLPSTGG